jgi:hypothetical protein
MKIFLVIYTFFVIIKSLCFQLDNGYPTDNVHSSLFIAPNLLIGSFNIQSLGPTKMSRPDFLSVATRILSKYDIVLIQEIKDSSSLNVINDLVININRFSELVIKNKLFITKINLRHITF